VETRAGGSDSWCACTRAICRRCRRAGARSRAATRRTESTPRSRSRTRSRPMWLCSPCTKPPKIPPPRRAQVTTTTGSIASHRTTHSRNTRHTTHDTRHTTHDTRHTTHDTRHTTHIPWEQTQRAKQKPTSNRGHGVLKSRAWRCSTLIRGYSLPPSVHRRHAFTLSGCRVPCAVCRVP
jgi:hypothetical protein